ncbi:MAG TPA: ROK family transcriptional regulator [Solirubrobacteraceae bacterium]|nr:ROK family transcriptional regulator [Solirubrobacteraceae bacterium]
MGETALRQRNRLRVVDALRRTGPATRADITRVSGLSRATVSSLVAELLDAGVLAEQKPDAAGAAAPRTGRPPVLLALDASAGAAVGVDFGHRHLRVAVADLSAQVLAERRVELDVDHEAAAGLDAAAELIGEVLADAGVPRETVLGCGMGLPGPIDRATGTVGSTVILPGWVGLHAAEELAALVELPVAVDNDANLGALAEMTYGAARGVRDLLYVKVASGIGCGVVIDGRVHHGSRGIAGEIGHVHVDAGGRICRCGNRGCLETVAGGAALLALLRESHGEDLTLPGLLALSAHGDVGARRALGDAGRAIGRALADACNILNPELIVFGGELATAGDPLLGGVREALGRYALPAAVATTRVTRGVLGDRAEVLGALALVIADTENLRSAGLGALSTTTPTTTTTPVRGGST